MNPLRQSIATSNPQAGETASGETDQQPSARDAIFKLLELEGCSPRIDNEGDIQFQYRDLRYHVLFNAEDPEYLRILLPAFRAIDTDKDRAVAYEAANLTNATCKAAKIMVERGQTFATVEIFEASHHHVVPVLMRCAHALEYAARSYGMAFSMIGRR